MSSFTLVSNIVLGLIPLLVLFRPNGLASYFRGSRRHRVLAAIGLGVAYLGARLIFILAYNLLFFGTRDFPPDPQRSPALGVGVDVVYWLVVRVADRYWREEHYLYKSAAYYLAEPWILVLAVVVAYSFPGFS